MKKFTLLLSAIFMAVSLMADTYSHTFANGDLKIGSVTLSNVAWNFSMTGSTYFGWDATKGIQMGKSKEPATSITLSTSAIAGKITSVVVNTSGASGVNTTLGVKVNGVSYTANSNQLTTTATDYTFTGAESGDIVITWTNSGKGLYIKSLKVEYENIVAGVPTISANNIDFGTIFATDTTKTLTVVGSDLTKNITATLKTGIAFELSGDLTKDGGDLAVKFIATTAGTYSDEITLTSGETTKTIAVSANYVVFEGDGTEENPYTCADVKNLNNTKKGPYWVKGYILGCINSNENNKLETSSFTQASNLALGATADAKDYVPVQLSSGSTVREALNLVNNANMAGALVKVYGTLEVYFSKPGVKSVSDYEIIESAPEVEATAIALDKTTLALEQYREDKLVATLTPAEATTQIVWTSSNAEVATVENGLVKAVGVGEATITAKAGELTATCVVTVSEATVLTCVKAAEMAIEATANNAKIEGGQYVVSGYVTEIAFKYSAEEGNMSVWIADTKDGGKVFELYKVEPQDGVIPVVGDSVVAIGYLTKYNTTPEMAAGCVCRVIKNDGPTTNVDVTTISNIYTLNRTIVAEGEFEIYTVTGQNVTGMNGSLENGVYVVRTANATVKVVVK